MLRRKKTEGVPADPMVRAVDHAVRNALRLPKLILRLLVVGVVLLIGACSVLGMLVVQNQDNSSTLRQDAITQCEAGNAFRAGQTEIWEKNFALQAANSKATASLLTELIFTLANGNTAKIKEIDSILSQSGTSNQVEISEFLKYVKQVNAPHNCQQAYDNVSGDGASSGNAATTTASVTWSTVHVQNWGGYCLTVVNANVGTRVSETTCGHDHAWELGSNGILYPQGHSNVAVGDSGGYMTLRSPGTSVSTNNSKLGPDNFSYDRMGFGSPTNYFWHANGNGAAVTLITNPGSSLAVYWAFLGGASPAARTV